MEGQLRAQAAANVGHEQRAMDFESALAQFLSLQGRNDEAVLIFEANLELKRRVLPSNHPNIGEQACGL
jgi:hypothetical protein